jgi:hypothetical protein
MKKILIAVVLLVVAAGGVTLVYGSQFGLLAELLFSHPPKTPFSEATAPPASDYAKSSSWAALPGIKNPSDATPQGYAPVDPAKAEVDVFFIHPTSYFSSEHWNQPLDDAETNKRTDDGSIRNQASVFNGCCRIYAPRYRQMTFSGFLEYSDSSKKAMDLAYSDVKRAFEYYLVHYNHSRPFIIASHSQGSRHAVRLVQEMIDNTPLRGQFVAAYIIGNWVSQDWFDNLKTIKPCERADDTGCVLTWSTLREGADAQAQRQGFAKRSGLPLEAAGKRYVCTNPLSWTTSTAPAPANLDLGGWVYGTGETPRAPDPHLVSARCDNGALYVSTPDGLLYSARVLPGGNYHNYDYQLAYLNIRKNAMDRVKAFTEERD